MDNDLAIALQRELQAAIRQLEKATRTDSGSSRDSQGLPRVAGMGDGPIVDADKWLEGFGNKLWRSSEAQEAAEAALEHIRKALRQVEAET